MLNVNNLIGFGAGGAGITEFGVRDNHVGTVSSTTHTWTGASLGAAAADRLVIVTVVTNNVQTNPGHLTMTIGGVSATKHIEDYSGGGNSHRVSIWGAIVASGTTGNIVLTVADTGSEIMMTSYSCRGASNTPHDTASDPDGPSSGTKQRIDIDLPAGGVFVGCCMDNIDPTGFVWSGPSGLTEDYDTDVGAVQMGSASLFPTILTTNANINIESTPTKSDPVIVGASFGAA